MCILTFTIVVVYNFIYSLVLYAGPNGCTQVTDSKAFNNFLWFVSRGIANIFWIYPFIY